MFDKVNAQTFLCFALTLLTYFLPLAAAGWCGAPVWGLSLSLLVLWCW